MMQGTPSVNLEWKSRMTGRELGMYFLAQSINRLPVDRQPAAIRAAINNRI